MSQKGQEDILECGMEGNVLGEDVVVAEALGACVASEGLIELRWCPAFKRVPRFR